MADRFRPGHPGFVDELLRPHRGTGGAQVLDDAAGIGGRVSVYGPYRRPRRGEVRCPPRNSH